MKKSNSLLNRGPKTQTLDLNPTLPAKPPMANRPPVNSKPFDTTKNKRLGICTIWK